MSERIINFQRLSSHWLVNDVDRVITALRVAFSQSAEKKTEIQDGYDRRYAVRFFAEMDHGAAVMEEKHGYPAGHLKQLRRENIERPEGYIKAMQFDGVKAPEVQ